MRSATVQLILAVALAVAGYACWRAAVIERQVAGAARDLVTFRYDQPPAALAGLDGGLSIARVVPGTGGTLEAARDIGSTSRFWSQQYAALAAETEARPFVAANASYRALQREGGSWRSVVGRLDGIITAYADVMRQQPDNVDASYNYELAIRVRDAIAGAQVDIAPSPATAVAGDLPEGASVHGEVGAPPEGTNMQEFKMLVPMRPDERLEAEEAGQGGKKKKKG